jgi:hypothetical protein
MVRGLQAASAQVDKALRLIVARDVEGPAEEAIEDALAEAHLALHQAEHFLHSTPQSALRPQPRSGAERRQHERIDSTVGVRLLRHSLREDHGSVSLSTETATRAARNLSTGGLFVALSRGELTQVSVGNVLHVEIVGHGGAVLVKARAVVARRDDQGVGLSWVLDNDLVRRDVAALLAAVRRPAPSLPR